MIEKPHVRRARAASLRRGVSVLVCVSLLVPSLALADGKAACVVAHAKSQVLHKQGKLRQARAELVSCATGCPTLVQNDCAAWLNEVEQEQPSIVVSVLDKNGHDTSQARLVIDGQPVTEALDGRPIDVDPGLHAIRCELTSGESREASVFLSAREKAHLVRLDFTSAPAPAPAPSQATPSVVPPVTPSSGEAPARSIPTATWVLGGLGVIALGAWAYFGISGKTRESTLASTCSPTCADDRIDAVRQSYTAADVSLAIALVSLGVATWIFLARAK